MRTVKRRQKKRKEVVGLVEGMAMAGGLKSEQIEKGEVKWNTVENVKNKKSRRRM